MIGYLELLDGDLHSPLAELVKKKGIESMPDLNESIDCPNSISKNTEMNEKGDLSANVAEFSRNSSKSANLDSSIDFCDNLDVTKIRSELDVHKLDLDESIDKIEPKDYDEYCENRPSGGRYGELKNEGWGWNDQQPHEIHHMPSCESSPLERNDGPAIAMDYADHRETASCGNSREAQEYRKEQKRIIEGGDFGGAMQMDIDDIHDKFGDKYDDAIAQMQAYYKCEINR